MERKKTRLVWMNLWRLLLLTVGLANGWACGSGPIDPCAKDPEQCLPDDPCAETNGICPGPLKINELMPKNDGAWIDEALEADDWIELINIDAEPLTLLGYTISDTLDNFYFLPMVTLAPGETLLVWADNDPDQGPNHLPFKLAAEGETLYLWTPDAKLIDRITYAAMGPNDSLARVPSGDGPFTLCPWASPGQPNGDICGPPPPPSLPEDVTFADFVWPNPWPAVPGPLALNELGLRPAAFVEVRNTSTSLVDLSTYRVTIAGTGPGLPWPDANTGTTLSGPAAILMPGERLVLSVTEADVADIGAAPDFEGVVTLWEDGNPLPVDRVDFMAWPVNASLARFPETAGQFFFCDHPTPNGPNDDCQALPSRPIGDRLRHIYTPNDFQALAEGGVAVGMESVKFVVDMDSGHAVHLLSSEAWDLHYTFIREQIDQQPHLDRCDPVENQLFYSGWGLFSQEQYFAVETRRYLLGTLVHHAGADRHTVEFTTGDMIVADQMKRAFFDVVANMDEPTQWFLRPQSDRQITEMRQLEGQAPIIGPNAPFANMTFQPLNEGLAYGTLRFVSVVDLPTATLGRQVVVVTDQVPNDIPLVGGLVTETFQTPLAHVNVLSRNRGTPNMALLDARIDPRLVPYFDTLVRFEVTGGDFRIAPADPAEAEAFWESQNAGDPLTPRLDTSVRGVQPLWYLDLDALPAIGAKAAGLAELGWVWSNRSLCPGPINTPSHAAAIPVVHSVEHYEASGAADRLATYQADARFNADPQFRANALAEVRDLVLSYPVDPTLLAEVEQYVRDHFGLARVRFRSSSNTEDLPQFSGAGLYTSVSGELENDERRIEDAIRIVWASLYNTRAYEERELFRVDRSRVAMGVLLHPAYLSEEANGVGISRNILDPIRSDYYFLDAQVGEASVTNPAPGVSTEQLIYRWGRSPPVVYYAFSSLPHGIPVLSQSEIDLTSCTLHAIHDHFRPLLDPLEENRWFAMDIEFKLIDQTRELAVKQARPYSFGNADIPADCREF